MQQAKQVKAPMDEDFEAIFVAGGVKLNRQKKATLADLRAKFKAKPTKANRAALLSFQEKCVRDATPAREIEAAPPKVHTRERERMRLIKKNAVRVLKTKYLAARDLRSDWDARHIEAPKRREAWVQLRDMTLAAFIFAHAHATEKEARIRKRMENGGGAVVRSL